MSGHCELFVRVVGEPAPQGSKRYLGNGRMAESSRKVGPWRQDVALQAASCAADRRWTAPAGPVRVELVFRLRRPVSAPKRRTRPDRKPDVDKLARSTLDALVTAGVIEDDARVVELVAVKEYSTAETGASIIIRDLSRETE